MIVGSASLPAKGYKPQVSIDGGAASIGSVNLSTTPFTLFENSARMPDGVKHGFSFSIGISADFFEFLL